MSLPPVERNIFSPVAFNQSAPALLPNQRAGSFGEQGSFSGSEEGKEGEISSWPGHNLSIRYIGYVHGQDKIVALVIVNGLALAVEAGDFLEAQVKVVRITAEEVILAGPAGEERRVSLEGEKNEKN